MLSTYTILVVPSLTFSLQCQVKIQNSHSRKHIMMRLLSILAVASLYRSSLCTAQEEPVQGEYQPQRSNVKGFGPDLTGVDPALIVYPPPRIDYPGCFKDLVTADRDGNGIINHDEYLGFIQEYGKRLCYEADKLSLEQHAAFSSLACLCRSKEGTDSSCCLEENAKIPTDGALNPTGRTEEEMFYLTTTCRVTDGTIDSSCPPYIKEAGTPPPVMIVPVNNVNAAEAPPEEDDKPWEWVFAALAGLLLLLCCVCCCVIRRKRAKAVEEEIEEVETTPGKGVAADEEAPAEQAVPRAAPGAMNSVPPLAPTDHESDEDLGANRAAPGGRPVADNDSEEGDGKPRKGDNEDDSDSEGEGGRKRGSNYVPDEDENTRRKWPSGQLPPTSNDLEKVVLRPIPNKEQEENPDWDQPGRDMDNVKVKDDDSVQEFERYVPDCGVPVDNRAVKDPVTYKRDWNRGKAPEDDENDNRKHRIQSGMGEGEIWDKLDNTQDEESKAGGGGGPDIFDWVVSSAMDALHTTEEAGHLDDDTSQVDNASVSAPLVENKPDASHMSFR
jgi:hypothetical protein